LNPSKPAILGELKITGFSSYLHSINDDNTLLVGVGEEADKDGMILGLKIALFDTSDPKSPKLLHNATVEKDQDAWSSSDATYDFKAFRWLKKSREETGVVILPVRSPILEPECDWKLRWFLCVRRVAPRYQLAPQYFSCCVGRFLWVLLIRSVATEEHGFQRKCERLPRGILLFRPT
jgi:hypothetical protein